MQSFGTYLNEQLTFDYGSELLEALITFGGKAYPKFGNVVIMAGGAGSGKGFVKSNLMGIEGKTLDPDELKRLVIASTKIANRVKAEFDIDLKSMNLKNPKDVADLHNIVDSVLQMRSKQKTALFSSILSAHPERKPNLLFDTTFKSLDKLSGITRLVQDVGYDSKNIHIIWIVNDIGVAIHQNKSRSRQVPTEILVNTHRGASQTMQDVISMGTKLSKYMDGDIVFAFNKVGVDTDLEISKTGGSYIKKANYVYIKKRGQRVKSISEIDRDVREKIQRYVPKGYNW